MENFGSAISLAIFCWRKEVEEEAEERTGTKEM